MGYVFFFQAEDGIRDTSVTGVQSVLFRSYRATLSATRSAAYAGNASSWRPASATRCPTIGPSTRANACSTNRSEERRVGKERRAREATKYRTKKKVGN